MMVMVSMVKMVMVRMVRMMVRMMVMVMVNHTLRIVQFQRIRLHDPSSSCPVDRSKRPRQNSRWTRKI